VDTRSPKYLSSFGPTIDRRSVLPRDIRRLMTKPREAVFAGVALLVGLSRVDAAFYLTGRDLVDGLDAGRLRRMLRTYVQNTFVYHRQYIYDVLVHQYTDWERTVADAQSRRDSLVELLADGMYVAPGVELAQRHAALGASATYMYQLNYPSRVTGTYCRFSATRLCHKTSQFNVVDSLPQGSDVPVEVGLLLLAHGNNFGRMPFATSDSYGYQ